MANNGSNNVSILLNTTVQPNQAPMVNAGSDQTGVTAVECTGLGMAQVTLDGSGSSDPDLDTLTYNWTWATGSASGVMPTVTLGLGDTTITLTVDDGQTTDSDTVLITVQDMIAPTITAPPDVTVEATGPSGQAVAIGTVTATDSLIQAPPSPTMPRRFSNSGQRR